MKGQCNSKIAYLLKKLQQCQVVHLKWVDFA